MEANKCASRLKKSMQDPKEKKKIDAPKTYHHISQYPG
jgi:hypothetical protein